MVQFLCSSIIVVKHSIGTNVSTHYSSDWPEMTHIYKKQKMPIDQFYLLPEVSEDSHIWYTFKETDNISHQTREFSLGEALLWSPRTHLITLALVHVRFSPVKALPTAEFICITGGAGKWLRSIMEWIMQARKPAQQAFFLSSSGDRDNIFSQLHIFLCELLISNHEDHFPP